MGVTSENVAAKYGITRRWVGEGWLGDVGVGSWEVGAGGHAPRLRSKDWPCRVCSMMLLHGTAPCSSRSGSRRQGAGEGLGAGGMLAAGVACSSGSAACRLRPKRVHCGGPLGFKQQLWRCCAAWKCKALPQARSQPHGSRQRRCQGDTHTTLPSGPARLRSRLMLATKLASTPPLCLRTCACARARVRRQQDEFAVRSHKKAAAAQAAGKFKAEIVPVATKVG